MWLVKNLPGAWLPASSLVTGPLPGSIFVWDFLVIWGDAVRGIRWVWSASALTWVSLGLYLWLDAKPFYVFVFFCQAWVTATSVSCSPCSISNCGCLLSIFQKNLSLPKGRKLIMSAQPESWHCRPSQNHPVQCAVEEKHGTRGCGPFLTLPSGARLWCGSCMLLLNECLCFFAGLMQGAAATLKMSQLDGAQVFT